MSVSKRWATVKSFLHHLARGVVKSIPFVGGLLEEAIFGTLEERAAAEERAKTGEALADIRRRLPPITVGEQEAQAGPVFRIPFEYNPFFTGRTEQLSQLRDTLASEGRAALKGLGGMGKTQIAVEYAYRHRDTYSAVLWSQANSREALVLGFIAIARLLNLRAAEEKDQSLTVAAVKRWLEDHTDWLLVFDNADKPELVKDFLPPAPKGHILFTSRAPVFQTLGIANPIEVKEYKLKHY